MRIPRPVLVRSVALAGRSFACRAALLAYVAGVLSGPAFGAPPLPARDTTFVDACPEGPLTAVLGAAAQIEVAYVGAEDDDFLDARFRFEIGIPCLVHADAELSPKDAMTIHRAEAILAVVDGDEERARRALLAVRGLAPDWKPSEGLMPPGSDLRRIWENTANAPPATFQTLASNAGGWNVSGTRTDVVPTDRNYILQFFSPSGDVEFTRACENTACVAEAEQLAIAVEATRKEVVAHRMRRIGLGIGLGGAAIGLVGGIVVLDAAGDLHNLDDPAKQVSAGQRRSLGTGLLVGGSALAVGAGVTTLVVTF